MWNSGKKIRALRDKKKYSNSCVVRKKNSERNKKPLCGLSDLLVLYTQLEYVPTEISILFPVTFKSRFPDFPCSSLFLDISFILLILLSS